MQDNRLLSSDGTEHQLLPQEFWYVVPDRTSYSSEESRIPQPLEFAFVLNNAAVCAGLLPAPSEITNADIENTFKGGAARDAEHLLERLRAERYPFAPSRFCCHFLNADREVADHRMREILRGDKRLVRCFAVSTGAKLHYADAGIYERLEGRPEDEKLADLYWHPFAPTTQEETMRLEVVSDCKLYFPEWRSFPRIDTGTLAPWGNDFSRRAR